MGLSKSGFFYQKQIKEGIKRKIPNDLNAFGGANWITITRACAIYVSNYIAEYPYILEFFKYVIHPEEIFFQTIILNSNFKSNVIDDNLRYIDWKSEGPKPKILTIDDAMKLQESHCLFARKFDMSVDSDILTYINQHLL